MGKHYTVVSNSASMSSTADTGEFPLRKRAQPCPKLYSTAHHPLLRALALASHHTKHIPMTSHQLREQSELARSVLGRTRKTYSKLHTRPASYWPRKWQFKSEILTASKPRSMHASGTPWQLFWCISKYRQCKMILVWLCSDSVHGGRSYGIQFTL